MQFSSQSQFNPQSQFNTVTIIGNANGEWRAATQGYTVIFNGTVASGERIINICNGPYAGSTEDFVVTGHHSDWLALQLSLVAKELETQLNCWPSSGLVSYVLFSRLGCDLSLSRMSLLPSLTRGSTLHQSEHLPCVVHNWLGERRVAIKVFQKTTKNQIHWPELLLTKSDQVTKLTASKTKKLINDPFAELLSLSQIASKTESCLNTLIQLSKVPLTVWQSFVNQDKLLKAEQLFYNQNPYTTSGYWYLSDNEASAYLDAIRLNLALCQQALFNFKQYQ
ncbi:hypothetical protein [Shewanella sp. TC10]|uniref:hypothetical protein n=1 Tax=Shewanella sp. TC10 TaxID=1419739 RepID=UPI00129D9A4E|nr:hypothetical protein [Shewanella sp. TC10]